MNATSNLTTCPALSSMNATTANFTLGEGGANFSNTVAIIRGHNTPRFGHVQNITLAITGTDEEAKSYLVGLLGASIVMFAFFLVWLVVVLVLKCLGYKLTGFLSGSSMRIPARPSAPATTPEPVNDNKEEDGASDHEKSVGTVSDSVAGAAQQRDEAPDAPKTIGAEGDGDEEEVHATEQAKDDIPQGRVQQGEVSNSLSTDKAMEEWEAKVKATERTLFRIRIIVVLSGLVIVVMAILMVAFGVKQLNNSVQDGEVGLVQGENLAYSGVGLIDSYMYHQNATLTAAQDVATASNQTICPQAKALICSNASFDCSVLENDPPLLTAVDKLYEQLSNTKRDLNEAAALLNDVNEYIDRFAWAFWVASAFVLLLAICTLLILNGIYLASKKKLHGTCWQRSTSRIRGWVIVPVFVALLILGWIFSMVFVIGSSATGDFCIDSPDDNVVALLNENKDKFSANSLVFPALVFYVSGCPANSTTAIPLPSSMPNVTVLLSYLDAVNRGIEAVASNSALIAAECGTNPETLQSAMNVLVAQVCTITTTVGQLLMYFSCPNFNSVYSQIAYQALCYTGNAGMSATAITQFIILLCAMVMLTLRSAFYEIVDESELVEPRRCLSCCRRQRQSTSEAAPVDLSSTEKVEGPKAQDLAGEVT